MKFNSRRVTYFASAILLIGGSSLIGTYFFLGLNKNSPSVIQGLNSKSYTYKETLQGKNLTTVDKDTSDETMRNLIFERMFPNYQTNYKYKENQLFSGSPEIVLSGEQKTKDNKKIFVFDKSKLKNETVTSLREACIKVLEEEVSASSNPLYKLAEWCTVPVVKQVLTRHKFELNKKKSDWEKIINSEWFKNGNQKHQSFFNDEEYKKISNSQLDIEKRIKIVESKCKEVLNKQFERKNFPAPKSFLNSSENTDEFQEAALFCTKEKTAKQYVQESMKGIIKNEINNNWKSDFCYLDGKDQVNYYENIKTTDPMGGKTFWCAVRMIYYKYREDKK